MNSVAEGGVKMRIFNGFLLCLYFKIILNKWHDYCNINKVVNISANRRRCVPMI